jgi:hypothetical protein
MSSGIFEADEVGEKASGGTKPVHVQTLLEAFLNMSLRPVCFSDKAFSSIKQNSGHGATLLMCSIIRLSELWTLD